MVHLPGASALLLLSASSAFVKSCMIQNKGPRGHRREILHVRRNHGITAIVILKRIGRPLDGIFIFLLLKKTALLVQSSTYLWTVQSGMGYDQSTIFPVYSGAEI